MKRATDLSDLADIGPNHDSQPMPFDGVDVARMARQIESKSTRLTQVLFGLHPRGIAHLLRKLWLAGEVRAAELADVRVESRNRQYRIYELEGQLRSICNRLDQVIAGFGKKKAGVLIISESEMRRLEDEYTCTTKSKASSGERWNYTYKGFPVFTAREISGPVMMPADIFEGFKLNLGKAVTLVER